MNAIEQASEMLWKTVLPWTVAGGVLVLLISWFFNRLVARFRSGRKPGRSKRKRRD